MPWRTTGVQRRFGTVLSRTQSAPGAHGLAIQLMFDDSSPVLVDIDSETHSRVQLQLQGIPRGLHDPGRLVVSTRYPMGLLCAWCYVACSRPMLVYPKPGRNGHRARPARQRCPCRVGVVAMTISRGLRGYRPGDLPSQIDWKSYARERGLNTRYVQWPGGDSLWIDGSTRSGDISRAVGANPGGKF